MVRCSGGVWGNASGCSSRRSAGVDECVKRQDVLRLACTAEGSKAAVLCVLASVLHHAR